MRFPGTWMTESESMIYRVVPKCACSTIGQILYFSDHGRFYDGDIHDADQGLHKWNQGHSKPIISAAVKAQNIYTYTCVRNPYTRILSSFFDKICGIQRNGKRYRGNMVPLLMQQHGVSVGGSDNINDLSIHLMHEIYGQDFELFRYDPDDPSNKMPLGDIDLDRVHAELRR